MIQAGAKLAQLFMSMKSIGEERIQQISENFLNISTKYLFFTNF